MKRWLPVVAALLGAGCTRTASTGAAASSLPADDAALPFCVYAVTAPTMAAGQLSFDERPPHVDCIPPEPGAVFSLGFAAAGFWLQLDVPRRNLRLGEAIAIERGRASLLSFAGDRSCFEWDGAFVVHADVPAWSVSIDARCTSDAALAVIGRWSSD